MHISQTVKGVIRRNLCDIVFYMKTNVLQNFHICVSVPLKCFFNLKSSFRSEDILSFCLDFVVINEHSLIRKIRVNFKNLCHNLVNKELQYTYCPISQVE